MTNHNPYMTREGGATVTVFVPYDCKNHCPFCINKQEYQNPEGFRQSGPEGSSASQSGTASRVTLSLPPVRHSIPVVPITAHWSRTLSPAAFHRHQVAITRFVDHAASHPMERLREEMDAYIDDLARTIRARMMGSAIAPCPDAGVHAALQFGAAVTISEREHG